MKKILKNSGVQSFLASLVCIILGMLIGYIVLLIIEPSGAGEAIVAVAKNFLGYSKKSMQMKKDSSSRIPILHWITKMSAKMYI